MAKPEQQALATLPATEPSCPCYQCGKCCCRFVVGVEKQCGVNGECKCQREKPKNLRIPDLVLRVEYPKDPVAITEKHLSFSRFMNRLIPENDLGLPVGEFCDLVNAFMAEPYVYFIEFCWSGSSVKENNIFVKGWNDAVKIFAANKHQRMMYIDKRFVIE